MARPITILLIRHLPTEGNVKKEYIGWTDEPIRRNSSHQCTQKWEPKEVIGSDLLRAVQSAAIYFPKATYKEDNRWRETHFGEWERKTYEELKSEPLYCNWIQDPFRITPPGGESFQEMKERVTSAFHTLNKVGETQVIVTHGGPIRMLLNEFSPTSKDFWSWKIPHGGAWRLIWENDEDFKEGKRCTFLSEEPIMVNENM